MQEGVASVGGMGEDKLVFTLPTFPPSFNRLYAINHAQRKVGLSDEALLWKTHNSPYVQACYWKNDGCPLRLSMDFTSPRWLTQGDKLRRVDLGNLEKLITDTIFSKWGWDDCRIVELVTRKVWGETNSVIVTVERMRDWSGK